MSTISAHIFTLAQLSTAIEAMAKAQLTAANSIAKVIVMVAFAANHGFVNDDGEAVPTAGPANALFKNLRKGVRKDAIVAVLEQHCNLAYVSGTWAMFPAGTKDWSGESIKAIKVAAAGWESSKKPASDDKVIDVVDEFESMIAKITKALAKNKDSVTHATELVKLQELFASIKGELVVEVTAD